MQRTRLAAAALILLAAAASNAYDFVYQYGDPRTPLNDGTIVSHTNATTYYENPIWCWKPITGGTTFATTTPAEVIFHFSFDRPTSAIDLWMNMPTFYWSYSRGHNFLHGSTDGADWTLLAELPPPAYGAARDLGTVAIPPALIGADELWLRARLYSYGTSAPSGGVWTNTAQLSRWHGTNTTFRLQVNLEPIPEPTTPGLIVLAGLAMRRAR
jgi:hypothetical protein